MSFSDESTPSARWRRLAGIVARTLVAAMTLYLVFEAVSWRSLLNAFRDARFVWLAAGFLLLGANIWIRSAKWHYMLRVLSPDVTRTDSYRSLLLGISFGAVTPGEIGEFAGRALHIPGTARSHLVGLALLDRLHIFLVWIGFGVPSLAIILSRSIALGVLWSVMAAAGALVVFLHLDLLRRIGSRINDRFFRRPWLERILDGFGCLSPVQRRVTLLYTAAFHAILCVQMYFFLNAFTAIGIWQVLAGTSGLMFVKAVLPFSVGDLGIRELTSVYLFGLFGVARAAALNASLLMFFVNIVLPGVGGLLTLRHLRSRTRTETRA